MKQYILNNLISLDQSLNTLFGGYPDETISARCWRQRKKQPYKTLRPVIDRFFFACFQQEAHCQQSYASELKRSQSPKEERACR